jgi:bifunctional non-homologous end joining protein LigD
MPKDHLDEYRAKRDFSKTREPSGSETALEGDDHSFVVQKHAARRLHYDFRLEVEGVMPSWAVPKGPCFDPKVKRLAVHVEDHPLDYRDFEGKIGAGEYGGGAVIVWDAGTYTNISGDPDNPMPMRAAIEKGHVSVVLHGTKLVGGWSLTRTSHEPGQKENWILVKRRDERADPDLDITESEPASVRSGKTIEQVKASRDEDEATWTRGRATWSPPMLAELASSVPADSGNWLVERKLDGLRMIAVRNGDAVELWSRGHQPLDGRFGRIAQALRELPIDNFVLDGEVVAFAGDRTSFSLLQGGGAAEPVYEVFDVLHLDGRDSTELTAHDRHRLVMALVEPVEVLRPVEALRGPIGELLERACQDGWEGLIAKRAGSKYKAGRSNDWLKLKCSASQELVIGGFTNPRGARHHLGAILVGYFDGDHALRYAGKVGSGFSEATLTELAGLFASRERPDPPFVDPPRARDVHWVEPDLVANIVFTEWTADGKLRHPRFDGLRTDKAARDVVREAGVSRPS